MTDFGLKLTSELHGPDDLVEYALLAERSAFDFASVSDHFHPWLEEQGESPMVWPVLGAVARETDDLPISTGVTCPIQRLHPAIVAQGAATVAAMADGRFTLGVGTGENLNEHVLGDPWPPHYERLSMLEEALAVMRELWTGEQVSHDGEHYTVQNARLYTLPEEPPDVAIAADGPRTARTAGEVGDGLIAVRPDEELLDAYAGAADGDDPQYGEVAVCWAPDEDDASATVEELWRQDAVGSSLLWELPTPAHFEDATEDVTADELAEEVPCGSDADAFVDAVGEFVDAGFDGIVVHQIGPDQGGFVEFFEDEVLPSFE